ncbi:ATP-binding protein [Kineosporia succinea]|uniref:histidine kinase n=1 Tax=Kineosporia succinea TaxID=84632 RepID=A0ABT9P2H9_9ACTN|nr:ATP-binding protein [Kineosporia succinea]MDP9826863.1 PAS domain S-box-containing protein [Kineosporia succinea]
MTRSFRLLIIEDQPVDAELMVAELVRAGFGPDWTRVDGLDTMMAALDPPPGVILCDYSLPGLDAPTVLAKLHELQLEVPVIVVSGQMDEETCVKSLRLGAVDYLLKDRLTRLGPAVEHALATRRLTAEKREAERRERETAAILSGLVNHSPAAISVKAVDGRYLLVNRQFELLCGLAPGTLIGRIDAEIFPAEKAREMTELDARCLHTSIVVEREEEFDGRSLLCVRYPISDDEGEIFGIGAIYTEITRQKRVESDLRAARADIMSRAEKLAAGNNQLREMDRMKTDFVAAVSHELRNPLTSVRGYVEMLRDGGTAMDPELSHKFLDIIDRNSANVLSLVEDLLVLSRTDSGRAGSGQFQDISFPDLVSSAVATVEPAARQAGMTIRVRVGERLPGVLGDPSQLERVLVNLLSNAVKFSPLPTNPGARPLGGRPDVIHLQVIAIPAGVRLEVRDPGIGIPQAEQVKLFTRFFRASSATARGIPGTGLGLAVVKGVVDAHRGTIRVDSAPGRGTTMTVDLPAQK